MIRIPRKPRGYTLDGYTINISIKKLWQIFFLNIMVEIQKDIE